jgi:hypothetical protein
MYQARPLLLLVVLLLLVLGLLLQAEWFVHQWRLEVGLGRLWDQGPLPLCWG